MVICYTCVSESCCFFFCKQKTAYEMRISDWSSDVCSSDLLDASEVVVVGDPVPTTRPVTFTRESPRYGGPVAGLLTGRDALVRTPRTLGVLAVDKIGRASCRERVCQYV